MLNFKTVIFTVLLAVTFSCGRKNPDNVLTVSIEPQRYLLEKIAGDRWTVNSLLARGEDPESFDPSIADFRLMADSKAYFATGYLPFEEKLSNLTGDDVEFTDTSEGIKLLEGTHGECHAHNHAHHHAHHGHGEGEYHEHETDPHVWASVRNCGIMAGNMLRTLERIDPENAPEYRRNYESLMSELNETDAAISSQLSGLSGKSFMVWHPSLSYFARDYGLDQISIGMDNKELSARSFRQKIDEARDKGAMVFLVQPEFDNGRSASIAGAAGVESVTVNTMAYSLPSELLRISEIIKAQSKNR